MFLLLNLGQRLRDFRNGCAIAILCFMVGCSSHQETAELVEAEGVLKIDGKPAGNILVTLFPVGDLDLNHPSSSGVSNENGEFTLRTSDGRFGAVAGHWKITLLDLDEADAERSSRSSENDGARDPSVEPQETANKAKRIPTKYNTISRESLSIEVKEGGEPILIDVRG